MTTKFNPDQEVYIVEKDQLIKGIIDFITIESGSISYFISDNDEQFPEDFIFADKLDAVTYWLEINDIEISTDITEKQVYINNKEDILVKVAAQTALKHI